MDMGSKTCVIRNSADSSLPGGRQLMILNSSSVIKILNFKPTRAGTFHFYSAASANIASTRVSKIRGRRDVIFTYFITCSSLGIYKPQQFRRSTSAARQVCHKGLTGLQRQPRRIAIRPPSHCNNSPVATSGGSYGRKTDAFLWKNRRQKTAEIFATEEP